MNLAEKIFEEVRTLPEVELREVLDFVSFLKTRHGISALVASSEAVADWAELKKHARDLMTDPAKAPDLALMEEVRGKVCTGGSWTRDELYDRGLR